MAALRSFAPRMPVTILLGATPLTDVADRLLAAGAFEVVVEQGWAPTALHTRLRHVQWMAETYDQPPQAQPQSHSEEDRPLLAEVSHEMRSPLSSIIGFAESIEQEALGQWDSGEEQYRDYARHIRHSGQHLLDLFDDLLEIGDAQTFGVITPPLRRGRDRDSRLG